ncbi:DUF305 domain-containing protein [Gemmatimonas sp.]|uniref:DUF305 domain-containing protein n=1 Tax=Gemmatimonas sp. TaxID=1962908 RepID=UPI003983AB2C
MTFSRLTLRAVVAASLTAAAPARTATALPAQTPTPVPAAVEADIAFLRNMTMHHAQAITMSAMVRTHTSRPELLLLAERIEVSQQDEMAVMRRWLEEHGARRVTAPDRHGAHTMPGMLSRAQLTQLSAARDAAFDRLFLRFMIQHHEGALQMVATLRRVPGAAHTPMLFQFVTEIDTDQRAEIRRMQALLSAWSK